MIVWNGEQGTEEWHAVRRGIPTASCFGKIMTASTLKASTSQNDYLNQLVAEAADAYEGWQGNHHTENGHAHEELAATYYSVLTDVEVQSVGFVWRDETKSVGCSPDMIVGKFGGLELKCPDGKKHVANLRSGKIPAEYLAQVYGSLYVSGLDWWDWMSYHPKFPKQLIVRTNIGDDKYQKWLSKWEPELEAFLWQLNKLKAEFIPLEA